MADNKLNRIGGQYFLRSAQGRLGVRITILRISVTRPVNCRMVWESPTLIVFTTVFTAACRIYSTSFMIRRVLELPQ